jgi:hypothetical protein
MRMKGFRKKAGMGTPGRYESVTEAAKNGFSASGKKALKVDVLESVGTNSNRARCFGISGKRDVNGHPTAQGRGEDNSKMRSKKERKQKRGYILQLRRPFQMLW